MNRPVSAGDTCVVVGGLGRSKSPNLGLRVVVKSLRGEHSQHGRVWRCEGAGVQQLTDGGGYKTTGWADFPASWLWPIDPENTRKSATKTKELST